VNSNLLWRHVSSQAISPTCWLTECDLGYKGAAPAIELKREQVNLAVANAPEMRKCTGKPHIAKRRHNNTTERLDHFVA
jgi:hypothetical protein